jgi:hypothetical protein
MSAFLPLKHPFCKSVVLRSQFWLDLIKVQPDFLFSKNIMPTIFQFTRAYGKNAQALADLSLNLKIGVIKVEPNLAAALVSQHAASQGSQV